jgi:dipeptidyl-peptidase-3
MTDKNISPYNTRLFKRPSQDGKVAYELRLASVATTNDPCGTSDRVAAVLGEHKYKDSTIQVARGDYSPLLQRVVENLKKAKNNAANEDEAAMLDHYISSFMTGSIEDHKDGSRHWIRDKGPIVESYIGFIESYRDPFGVRGEFEGR